MYGLIIIIALLLLAIALLSYKYHGAMQRLRALERQLAEQASAAEPAAAGDDDEPAPQTDGAEPTAEGAADEVADPRARMMLVGLDADTVATLQEGLSDAYNITVLADSREAVSLAAKLNPDIIVSDYLMNGITGDVLCRELKSSILTSHIAVVFLTALSHSADIVYGLEAGAADYITKPFEIRVLRARLRRVFEQQQMVRRNTVEANLDKQENDSIDYSSPIDRKFMDNVNEILARQMGNFEFSTGDLYRELGMSRTVVYNKLKALTGHAPSDYIRIMRLNKAMALLQGRELNVSEVAYKVGYNDPKYFSTSFKKQFGVSPSKV